MHTVEEFLKLDPKDLFPKPSHSKEEIEDAWWDQLSDLLDQHPVGNPGK